MTITDDLWQLKVRLGEVGHSDLAEAVSQVRDVVAQKKPAGQPQVQDVDPTGTVRGPAGTPWMEENENFDGGQVRDAPPRKPKPNQSGIDVGVDVKFDTSSQDDDEEQVSSPDVQM